MFDVKQFLDDWVVIVHRVCTDPHWEGEPRGVGRSGERGRGHLQLYYVSTCLSRIHHGLLQSQRCTIVMQLAPKHCHAWLHNACMATECLQVL
jgi:hypothetical protein